MVLSSDKPVYGLYLCFQKMPDTYVIQKESGDGWVTVAEGGTFDLGAGDYKIRKLDWNEGALTYDDTSAKSIPGLDYNHLALSNIHLGVDSLAFCGPKLDLRVRSASMREKSGLQVDSLSGKIAMDSTRIYLPDMKYMDSDLAGRYSHAPDYPEVAVAAIAEMKRQVGSGLKMDDDGIAYRGLLVRHLVLPGHVDNSLRCLDSLDRLGVRNLSLMAQYYPPVEGLPAPLDRTVTADEYAQVTEYAESLDFSNIWTQELTAQCNYRPDFTNKDNPFGK